MHVVVEARANIDYAATRQRDNRNLAVDIGKDRAGDVELVGRFNAPRGHKRVQVRLLNADDCAVAGFDGRRWLHLAAGRIEFLSTTHECQASEKTADTFQKGGIN